MIESRSRTWVLPHLRENILVTGGAGFIGRAVVKTLVQAGARVRVIDSLIDQVHDHSDFDFDSEFDVGDVDFRWHDIRNRSAVRTVLNGIDSVVHLAAEVGVGQSMYAIERYTSVNDLGTAVLLEEISTRPIRRIVTASSMSVYGEGLYCDPHGRRYDDVARSPSRMRARLWDPVDVAGTPLTAIPTPESKRPSLSSVYAIGKFVQERLTMTVAAAYGVEAVALRLSNVFGPGQALSNPYAGVLAIFAARLANGRPPVVFEDGKQLRDFVHVDDVARAVLLALTAPSAPTHAINIASGRSRTIDSVARDLAHAMEVDIAPELTGENRSGDVRHCIADIGLAAAVLGFTPHEDFNTRLIDLAEWVQTQSIEDRIGIATTELKTRGLMV